MKNLHIKLLRLVSGHRLNSFKWLLPNIRLQSSEVKGFDKKLLKYGIEKKLYERNYVQLSSRTNRMNKYIYRQLLNLCEYAIFRDPKFFRLARVILINSLAFRLLALQHVLPKWHKDFSYREVSKWMNKLEKIIRSQSTDYIVKLIKIPKPDGGERPLSVPTKEWRINLALVNIFNIIWINRQLSQRQHGHRPGYGVSTFWRFYLKATNKFPNLIEFDYTKFHDRITYSAIKQGMKYIDFEEEWSEYVMKLNSCKIEENGVITQRTAGVPQGVSISAGLGMLVLEWLGVYRNPKFGYLGYADDGLIGSRSLYGNDLIKLLERILITEYTGISLKPTKTGIVKEEGRWLKDLEILGLKYLSNNTITAWTHSGNKNDLKINNLTWKEALEDELLQTLIGKVFCTNANTNRKFKGFKPGSISWMNSKKGYRLTNWNASSFGIKRLQSIYRGPLK